MKILFELFLINSEFIYLSYSSPSCASVGFISIAAREMSNIKQRNAWLLLAEEESLWSKVNQVFLLLIGKLNLIAIEKV